MEKNGFKIDTSKIGTGEKAEKFKKAIIKNVLENLEHKKPFGPGDLVTTLEGPFADIGLMVVSLKENGMVEIAPAPNTATVEIPAAKLFHFDDYHEAYKIALIEEQISKSDDVVN